MKVLLWLAGLTVGAFALLISFATVGPVPTLLVVGVAWTIYAVKSGSTKRWKDGTVQAYERGVEIQKEREEAERQARIAELERELQALKR